MGKLRSREYPRATLSLPYAGVSREVHGGQVQSVPPGFLAPSFCPSATPVASPHATLMAQSLPQLWYSSSAPVTHSVKHEVFSQTSLLGQPKTRLPHMGKSGMFGPSSVCLPCSAWKQVPWLKAKFFGWVLPVFLASSSQSHSLLS